MDLLFGNDNKKEIMEYEKIIRQILKYKKELVALSNDELKNKTAIFKKRIEILDADIEWHLDSGTYNVTDAGLVQKD